MTSVVDGRSAVTTSVAMDSEPALPDSTTNEESDDLFLDSQTENHKLKPHDLVAMDTRFKRLEKSVDNLLAGQMKMIKMIDRLAAAGNHSRRHSHRPASHPPHGKTKARPPSVNDMSTLLHLPYALQENINRFTKDLVFTRETELPDLLVEKECLSEDDYERICAKTTTIDQVRVLIRKIKDKGPKVIQTFLDVLEETQMYAHLADIVRKSTEKIAEEHRGIPACVVCVMKACVDIKDIVDDLWREHMISDDLHGQIVEGENYYHYRTIFWKEVTWSINQVRDKQHAMDVLKEALNNNSYNYIVDYLNQIPKESKLSCCCCKRRGLRPRPSNSFYESESEYSATCQSGQLCQNLPSRDLLLDSLESNSTSDLQFFDIPSNDMRSMSFDMVGLRSFDSIGGRCQDSVDSSRSEDSPRNRHTSGNFKPQLSVQHDSEEIRSLQYLHDQLQSDQIPPTDERAVTGSHLDLTRPDYHRTVSKQSNVTLRGEKTDSSLSSQEQAYDTAYKRSSTSDGAANSLDETHNSHHDNHDTTRDVDNVMSAHAPEYDDVITDRVQAPPIMDEKTVVNSEISDTNKTESLCSKLPVINIPTVNNPAVVADRAYTVQPEDKGNFADVEDNHGKQNDIIRRNRFRHRKFRINNRKLTPFTGGSFVTSSKPVTDNAESKLPAPCSVSRRSKASRNRRLRRQKSQQESDNGAPEGEMAPLSRDDSGDKGMKIPYSPMRGSVPQPRLVPRWDYNQVRRRRQIFQYHISPQVAPGQSFSDTEARTDESDVFTYSDYTV